MPRRMPGAFERLRAHHHHEHRHHEHRHRRVRGLVLLLVARRLGIFLVRALSPLCVFVFVVGMGEFMCVCCGNVVYFYLWFAQVTSWMSIHFGPFCVPARAATDFWFVCAHWCVFVYFV